jgi:hypothetical protein
MAITAIPIQPVASTSGNQWNANRLIEEATQTFKLGTVVSVKPADGGIQAWDGATLTGAQGSPTGVSYEAASNIASTGLGAPTPFSPLTGLGATLSFGSVPNQASAKNIPHGAPINDGRVGLIFASPDTKFSATFGNAGNTATPANTDVGLSYGLTLDTGANFWYVDKSKTGAAAAVKVVALDPRDVPAAGTRVIFQFLPAVVNIPNG